MKQRILSLIAMALMLLVLFTACSDIGTITDTDAGASEETTVSSEETTQQETEEKTHNVFGKFEAVTVDGERVDQTLFEGKITMVNIWATYCGPCVKEMPYFETISKEYADKNFQIVGIVSDVYMYSDGSHDEGLVSEAKSIIGDTGVSYVNMLPSAELINGKLSTIKYVPETVFLDEEGNLIGESYIGSMSYEDWCTIIDSVLENQ